MAKKYLAPLAAEDEVTPFEVPPNEITTGTAVTPLAPRPGTYEVVLIDGDGNTRCPKRIVETGLPAGEAAEAVARERYMHHYELVQRPGLIPDVKLME